LSFFVVFDTCTHAAYYGDVHQVLALPEGAVIRYEYKRRLFQPDAARAIETLVQTPAQLPMPVLLMYGEKMGFAQGDKDPQTMLSRNDSVFIPTRSASLVGVAIDPGATALEDVFYLHLQLRGFVSPDLPEIGTMVDALEAANALPFGDLQTQHTWISLLPPALDPVRAQLVSDDQALWPNVIDKFILIPTQFSRDVFWRVRSLSEEKNGAPFREIKLVDRATNLRVHSQRWQRDYPLTESNRYSVQIQTYSPHEHGADVPAGSSIAMLSSDDDQGLLKLAADPLPIVPNQTESKRFSILTDAALDTRFTGIHLETQVPNYTSKFPSGSMCNLTFTIRKERWRLGLGVALVALGTGLVGYVAGAKPDGTWSAVYGVLAALSGAAGGWFLNRQFKIGGGK
jgi:hypothetical protein